tara:strand:+ start:1058 stop:1363 length:306 start_codon:yes stop_codon:yes gene_type:complete
MASQIHESDIGTKLVITVKDNGSVVDISSASSLTIFIKKPNGTILTRTGTLETDGTDGKMYYIVVAGDLDAAGVYKIQGRVVLTSGTFSTSTANFKVHCNL